VAWLIFGVALRWPTLEPLPNYLSFASGRLAYSDVVVFYSVDNPIPYLERDIEYPVLTGLTLWLTSFMPGGIKGYFLANALVLSAALLGCFAYLARLGPSVRLTHFALAPGLAFYSVLNWDALGLLGLVAATYYMRRQQFGWAGASLALGASAKLFPAFVLPVLWAHTVHRAARPRLESTANILKQGFSPASLRFLTGFAVVMLALNLPLAMLDLRGWSYFLRFQAERTSNLDSIWTHLPPIPDQVQSLLFALLFLGGVLWLTLRVLWGDRWEAAALLSLLLFLLFTKVYSPQYDLWVLPLLALAACPVGLWLGFVLADVVYYWAIFFFYYVYAGGESRVDLGTAEMLVSTAVWVRELALGLLFVWGLTQLQSTIASPEARPLLSRALEALSNHTSELRQLRIAVEELRSEVAALRMAPTTHEGADAQRHDQMRQRAVDEGNVEQDRDRRGRTRIG
jgi:hypothetical protein